MAEPNAPHSWWQTLPGVLTATAGVITALTGLVVVLYQNGAFRSDAPEAVAQRTEASASPSEESVLADPGASAVPPQANAMAPGEAAPPAPEPAAAPRPWGESEAVLTARDGTVTTLAAETVSNCIGNSPSLILESGQEVGFERMRSFELEEGAGGPNAPAPIVVTLLSGGTLTGKLPMSCTLIGANDIGRFEIRYERLRRVEFVR